MATREEPESRPNRSRGASHRKDFFTQPSLREGRSLSDGEGGVSELQSHGFPGFGRAKTQAQKCTRFREFSVAGFHLAVRAIDFADDFCCSPIAVV